MKTCFAIFLLGIALLAGCDPQRVARLEEGVATEVDVRKQFGDPAQRHPTFGADGKVLATAKADDPREQAQAGR